MDCARTSRRTIKKKKRTSNTEVGPRVLRGEHLAICLLPKVTGSAADTSTFLLLNGVVVVGDGPRGHSTTTSRRAAGRDDYRFFKKKTSNQEDEPRVLRSGLPSIRFLPKCGWQRRGYINFIFAQRRSNRWTARALHAEPG